MPSSATKQASSAEAAVLQDEGYRTALAGLERLLLSGAATVPEAERRAAAAGEGLAGALGEYLARVQGEAHGITDEEVAALRRAGHGDDQLFELTVCAAFGAARRRLEAGLAAIAAAYRSEDGR